MNGLINLRDVKLKLRETVFIQFFSEGRMVKLIKYTYKDKLDKIEEAEWLLKENEYDKVRVFTTYENENGDVLQRVLQD